MAAIVSFTHTLGALYSQQGVLKIDLGESGTWVINRQIPNRQIWWSSPIRCVWPG